MVKRKFIQEPEVPVRTFVEQDKFDELVESIKAKGIIEPLICNDCGDHLEIIAGHRRFMASAVAGVDTLPCLVTKLSEKDIESIKLHENYGREDVSPVDEAFFFHEYMNKNGLDVNAFAKEICKSRNYVERRLSVLSFSENLLQAIRDGFISFSCAVELNKIDNEQELDRAIEYSRYNGCTARTAQAWVNQWQQTKAAIDHANTQPEQENESQPVGAILWNCFICDTPKNATETFTVPLCPECRKHIINQKEEPGGK